MRRGGTCCKCIQGREFHLTQIPRNGRLVDGYVGNIPLPDGALPLLIADPDDPAFFGPSAAIRFEPDPFRERRAA